MSATIWVSALLQIILKGFMLVFKTILGWFPEQINNDAYSIMRIGWSITKSFSGQMLGFFSLMHTGITPQENP